MRPSPGLLLSLFAIAPVWGKLTVAPLFTDHMVLQRELPVPVWGTAEPGAQVAVNFGPHRLVTRASEDGRWAVRLPALEASAEGRALTVEAGESVRLEDVLVGEVWLCSGQSNMEKPLGERKGQRPVDRHRSEIAAARHPLLRLYQVPRYGRVRDATLEMRWLPCSPASLSASEFSAVGYFFGHDLLVNLEVPVGIIHSSFGGTMIEAWMPPAAFAADPALAPLRDEPYFAWVEGVQATELYESMLAPLAPYAVRGFLWYQGEANAINAETDLYALKMRALIQSWREAWELPSAPFYYVQLAPFNYSLIDAFPVALTPEALPRFQEAQSRVLEVPHTGMVVTTDLAGEARDLHPTHKREVGLRLSTLALVETYGFDDRLAHGPRLRDWEVRGDGSVALRFDEAGEGLARADALALSHFTIAARNREFVPAEARIEGVDTVLVASPLVRHPEAVRFAWHETATPNLVNSAGLPARPFRTDDWPVVTTRPKPEPAND
jgi:sialate O-acetylesterase